MITGGWAAGEKVKPLLLCYNYKALMVREKEGAEPGQVIVRKASLIGRRGHMT